MTRSEFTGIYTQLLIEAIKANPRGYVFNESEAPTVAAKMTAAIERGSYNLERGTALWGLCQRVGIARPTRKALDTWYKENVK